MFQCLKKVYILQAEKRFYLRISITKKCYNYKFTFFRESAQQNSLSMMLAIVTQLVIQFEYSKNIHSYTELHYCLKFFSLPS